MKLKMKLFVILFTLIFSFSIFGKADIKIKTPSEYLGFTPGADRMLLDYEQLIGYMELLSSSSPKVEMRKIGTTPLGKNMYIAFISSEKNLKRLDELREINRELALNPDIKAEKRAEYIKNSPVFVLGTLSMHSGEVGPSQAAPLIAYKLATAKCKNISNWLDNVVYMMVPCHNPDGMDMVVKHYRKYKGTKYEGCSMPGVYHKYVGHDNNRDFVTLTQSDTKAIASICNLSWFPQVMVEKHQMGSYTARYYVPPNHDPIAENIDAGLWNWMGIFGSNLMKDMTKDGLAGVSQHYIFDNYWPGSTETSLWKNVISFLTESASAKYATPVFVEENELGAYGKGLSEYKKSVNMPLPWNGGWWKLSDIVDYEISSTKSIIKTASMNRKEILRFRNDLCKREVKRGKNLSPHYYILPADQHDVSEFVALVNLLREHGVKVFKLTGDISINGIEYKKESIVIPSAQPFRPFIKEVMEKQNFPVRHYTPQGEIIKPYDITSWSLPLHKGVKSVKIDDPVKGLEDKLEQITEIYNLNKKQGGTFWAALFSATNNESYRAAFLASEKRLEVERLDSDFEIDGKVFRKGSFLIHNGKGFQDIANSLSVSPYYFQKSEKIKRTKFNSPRVALVETWFHDMDAGWTRYIFDTYHVNYKVLRPADFIKTDLNNFDVIVFPDDNSSVLKEGKYKSGNRYYTPSYPPKYAKGMGKKGFNKLLAFLNSGGHVISWGSSTSLFTGPLTINSGKDRSESFTLPVNDLLKTAKKNGLYSPGSLLKIKLKKDHPLTLGMTNECNIFYRGSALFSTSIPNFDMDRRVIGKFTDKNILSSGYLEGENVIKNRSVLVWVKKNRGQLILMAFNPQFRASTGSTFKLLFNAIMIK